MKGLALPLFGLLIAFGLYAKMNEPSWVTLFNGKDLDDWTVKIRTHDLGENFANTFRVEDGLLKVRYDGYSSFDQQ